jgi:putative redox protein
LWLKREAVTSSRWTARQTPRNQKTVDKIWRHMETVLAGTGGCTAYDVVLILKRGRHDVRGCSVKLTSERAEVDPKVFTRIHMQFTVTGKGIPASAVERAIAMSHEKYCSASIMLGKTAEITTGFEVVEA